MFLQMMSIFWLYEKNEFGDEVPTGGVFVPEHILSMIFEEDVIEELSNMDLERMIWEEAISSWRNHRRYLIQKETDDFFREMFGDSHDDAQHFYDLIGGNKNISKKKNFIKKGVKQADRHRSHEARKITNIRNRIVDNLPEPIQSIE